MSGASHVTDGMLLAAAEAVASQVDVTAPGASLLPPVDNFRASSAIVQTVQDAMWQPVHPEQLSDASRNGHS